MRVRTTVLQGGKTATGIRVPDEVRAGHRFVTVGSAGTSGQLLRCEGLVA